MAEKEKQKIIKKLRSKFKLTVINEQTYEERWSMRLNRLNIIAVITGFTSIIIVLAFFLIAYTPLREYIPGYPDGDEQEVIWENYEKINAFSDQVRVYEQWSSNLMNILSGDVEIPDLTEDTTTTENDTNKYGDIDFSISKEDSLLREKIENEEKYNLSIHNEMAPVDDISKILFFPPLKGMITNKFNTAESHYGVDIVAAQSEVISATLDGTVIMATWTLETGYVIQIQHENNLVSVYKHNAELLKNTGSHVKAGDAIAIFGNTGEYSTGPHLHFELWHNGAPIDPEKFILF